MFNSSQHKGSTIGSVAWEVPVLKLTKEANIVASRNKYDQYRLRVAKELDVVEKSPGDVCSSLVAVCLNKACSTTLSCSSDKTAYTGQTFKWLILENAVG